MSVPVKARSYRKGTLRFRAAVTGGGIHLAIEIGVEDYLRGIS